MSQPVETTVPTRRDVDWVAMFMELRRVRQTISKISRETGLPRGSVSRWSCGHDKPKHTPGEVLIALWQEKTGKHRAELPIERLTGNESG